jgi:hypothetical protein
MLNLHRFALASGLAGLMLLSSAAHAVEAGKFRKFLFNNEIPARFATQASKKAPPTNCANFTGTWRGRCLSSSSELTFYFKQIGCDKWIDDGGELEIGKINVRTIADNDGGVLGVEWGLIDWNRDASRLFISGFYSGQRTNTEFALGSNGLKATLYLDGDKLILDNISTVDSYSRPYSETNEQTGADRCTLARI